MKGISKMRKKLIIFSLLAVLTCSVAYIANHTNMSADKKDVKAETSENDVTDRTETESKAEEKLEYEDDDNIVTSREITGSYEDLAAYIHLDHVDAIGYPGINSFDISVPDLPCAVEYCEISTDLGKVSSDFIKVKKERQLTYYVPSDFESRMRDTIVFKFYDEDLKIITEIKTAILYNENKKQIEILEVKDRPGSDRQIEKGKKYVLENGDELIITGREVDVSGKTYKQIKKEMRKEAKEKGGVAGD